MMSKIKSLPPLLGTFLLALAMFMVFLLASARVRDLARWDEALAAYRAGKYHAALKELRPRAESGTALAQTILGHMYQFGEGVPQSAVIAYALYNLAAASDPSKENDAPGKRGELAKVLSTDEIEQAQSLTRQMTDPKIGLSRALDQYSASRGTASRQ
jgi:TPR repeat protein